MRKLLLPFRAALLALLFCGFSVPLCLAQVQYADHVVTSMTTGLVTDDYKAADNDMATKAILKPTAVLSYTSVRVAFKQLAAGGKSAGVYIKAPNFLGVDVGGVAAIHTYMATSSGVTLVKSYFTSSLLSLATASTGVSQFTFTPTAAFNQLEVEYHSVLAVGKDIEFYEAYSTAITPLPVQLTTFQAKATPTGVALTWDTASELNSDHFVVERADASGQDFRAIGQVQGAGSSTQAQHYQFTDATPGTLGYYRLRQVDHDGTEAFSPTLTVRAEASAGRLVAYPTVTTDKLTVTSAAGSRLSIFNQSGQQVTDMLTVQDQALDVSRLPGGVYYVRDAATGQSTRFVKASGE